MGQSITYNDKVPQQQPCVLVCSRVRPAAQFLNQLYSRFDALLDIYKVYKVETIGDCFMVRAFLRYSRSSAMHPTLPCYHCRLQGHAMMQCLIAFGNHGKRVWSHTETASDILCFMTSCSQVAGGLVAQDEDGWRTTITHDRLHAVRVLAFAKVGGSRGLTTSMAGVGPLCPALQTPHTRPTQRH